MPVLNTLHKASSNLLFGNCFISIPKFSGIPVQVPLLINITALEDLPEALTCLSQLVYSPFSHQFPQQKPYILVHTYNFRSTLLPFLTAS
jgi:hypothetical protein